MEEKNTADGSKSSAEGAKPARVNDPDKTRQDILNVAIEEFAAKGLAGARVDEIASRTRTSKRMIYYYFGSKEGLYIRVLEEVYHRFRAVEREVSFDGLPPEEALRKLVGFTFDGHQSSPAFVRIVMNENLHQAEFLKQSKIVQSVNVAAIETTRRILERGQAAGVFRTDMGPVDLHLSISSLCFFVVSNRHTFSTIFRYDLSSPAAIAASRARVIDTILSSVLTAGEPDAAQRSKSPGALRERAKR